MKAAIEWIQKTVKQLEHMGSIRKPKWPGNKLLESLRQILPALEAAEKVNKIRAIIEIGTKGCGCRYCKQIRALLESLPDAKE